MMSFQSVRIFLQLLNCDVPYTDLQFYSDLVSLLSVPSDLM